MVSDIHRAEPYTDDELDAIRVEHHYDPARTWPSPVLCQGCRLLATLDHRWSDLLDELLAARAAASEERATEGDPSPPSYEDRVETMAKALHEDCRLEWQAIGAVDPGRLITQHLPDAHYGQAHDLVRRLWPELDRV